MGRNWRKKADTKFFQNLEKATNVGDDWVAADVLSKCERTVKWRFNDEAGVLSHHFSEQNDGMQTSKLIQNV